MKVLIVDDEIGIREEGILYKRKLSSIRGIKWNRMFRNFKQRK